MLSFRWEESSSRHICPIMFSLRSIFLGIAKPRVRTHASEICVVSDVFSGKLISTNQPRYLRETISAIPSVSTLSAFKRGRALVSNHASDDASNPTSCCVSKLCFTRNSRNWFTPCHNRCKITGYRHVLREGGKILCTGLKKRLPRYSQVLHAVSVVDMVEC